MKAEDECTGSAPVKLDIKFTNEGACWHYGYTKLYTVIFSAIDKCGNPSNTSSTSE
jgi:hypothetical protein